MKNKIRRKFFKANAEGARFERYQARNSKHSLCLPFNLFFLISGLYLYMLVVQTFSGDNIRFNLYAVIGWGE